MGLIISAMTAAFRKTITLGQLVTSSVTVVIFVCSAGFGYYKSTSKKINDIQTNQLISTSEKIYLLQTLDDVKTQLHDIRVQQSEQIKALYDLKAELNNKENRKE